MLQQAMRITVANIAAANSSAAILAVKSGTNTYI
jgi:hypothetical protein